jgi:hypothetical protein
MKKLLRVLITLDSAIHQIFWHWHCQLHQHNFAHVEEFKYEIN